ncbi:MAG: sulfatase [Desulfuromonadales bacterium]
MIKGSVILLSCLLGAAICAYGADPVANEQPHHEQTNVILISLQCLRADHLGVYGYKRDTSRNIDSLAKKSVLFENAISQANLTPVAQMSVLTSKYPRVNGMVSFEVTKDAVTSRTLPEILKYYGYTTAATLSSPEFFMRFDAESGTMINPGDVFSRSFDYYGRTARGPQGGSIRTVPTDAFQWLKNNKDKKFFLWIGSGLIHMPYAAAVPAPYKTMYDLPGYTPFWKNLPGNTGASDLSDDPSYDIFSRVYHNDYYWGFKPVYHLTDDDVSYVKGRYDAGVYYTDLFVGELIKLLDSLQLTEKTLIVLQSMHGDDLGEQGLFFHYDVTEPVIKNALMIRFPNGESGGKRVTQQVQGLDVMPTVLNYLDIPVPHDAQGSSLLPLVRGEAGASGSEYVFIDRLPWWEYTLSKWYLELQNANGGQFAPVEDAKLKEYQLLLQNSFDKLGYPPGDISVRSNDWKLILRKNRDLLEKVSWWRFITDKVQPVEEMELYNLKNDPGEMKNLVSERPEIVNRMKSELLEWDASTEKQKAVYKKYDKRYIIPYP